MRSTDVSKGTHIGDGIAFFGPEGFAALPVEDRVHGEVVERVIRKAVEGAPVDPTGYAPQVTTTDMLTGVRVGATTVEYEFALRVRVFRDMSVAAHDRMIAAARPIPGAGHD